MIPYLLAAVGGYLIGDSMKDNQTFADGGETAKAKKRLEELRKELRAESISWGELAELESLKGYIDKDDVELLEAAGVPEFDSDDEYADGGMMAKGGKVTYGSLYPKIVNSVMKEVRVSREEAVIIVENYESYIIDLIEYEGVKNPKEIAEAITSDYASGYGEMADGGMAKGGRLNTYKLRAEGLDDFLTFLQEGMYMRMKSFTVEPVGVPDVVITFVTDASLSEIKSKLREIPDSHVMLETVKPINQYTGERADGGMMADGGGTPDVKSLKSAGVIARNGSIYYFYNDQELYEIAGEFRMDKFGRPIFNATSERYEIDFFKTKKEAIAYLKKNENEIREYFDDGGTD